jgi:hypothetical protein
MYKCDEVKREIKFRLITGQPVKGDIKLQMTMQSFILGHARVSAHSEGGRSGGKRMYKTSSDKPGQDS